MKLIGVVIIGKGVEMIMILVKGIKMIEFLVIKEYMIRRELFEFDEMR